VAHVKKRFTTAGDSWTLLNVVERATATGAAASEPPPGEEAKDLGGEHQQIEPASVGQRLRRERMRQHIGLRELARRVGVSASLVSQIELGRATPSVSTLYSIVQQLNMSMDQLFFEPQDPTSGPAHDAGQPWSRSAQPLGAENRSAGAPVVRADDRHAIRLDSGVTWESMSPDTGYGVDFLYAIYDVDGESAPADALMRHGGREYGYLLEGRLGVTVGFATHVLEPGDSISFDSTTPHRLFNIGDKPAKAIWCVIGREDPRAHGVASAASPPG
jgi:transcriptional regulator with XRE-family HTH domain